MAPSSRTASLILAAGRGTRMKGYTGSKALLPLVPGESYYGGTQPFLLEILNNLPPGPKAVVVNHRKEDIIRTTKDFDLTYCEQPVLNGTGGALLSAQTFLKALTCEHVIITYGDVPLVTRPTFMRLIEDLKKNPMTVLGFRPDDKRKYGVLETDGSHVRKITEWEYWKEYPKEKQEALSICNSGIYGAKTQDLLHYLGILATRPHKVQKEINGKMTLVEEFFITDIVEYICNDGFPVGYIIGDEDEVMGIDDLSALKKAQKIFEGRYHSRTMASTCEIL